MRYKVLLTTFIYAAELFCQQAQDITCVSMPGMRYNSCELFTKRSSTGKQIPSDPYQKASTATGSMVNAKFTNLSLTARLTHLKHPSGQECFTDEGNLASLLQSFLSSVEDVQGMSWEQRKKEGKDNLFLRYFTRIQLLVLFELYQYLLAIYTTLNVTHVDSIKEYISQERDKALNKKTIIVSHLLNIIETQMTQAIQMRFPALNKKMSAQLGPMLLLHDHGANLDIMITGQEKYLFPESKDAQTYIKQMRDLYSTILGKYLKFFSAYTNQLHGGQLSAFYQQARTIDQLLRRYHPSGKSGSVAIQQLRTINPPIFFYEPDTFRAIKLIPELARELPKKSVRVPWPSKIVQDAISGKPVTDRYGNVISTYPRAFFINEQQEIVNNKGNAVGLFINIPIANNNVYCQEIIVQPDWLNTYEGVMDMLCLCLGNYAAAFSSSLSKEYIFDPCISYILLAAMKTADMLKDVSLLAQAQRECMAYFVQYISILAQAGGEESDSDQSSPPRV